MARNKFYFFVQWHWFGKNRHALVFIDSNEEILFALRLSRENAIQLIELGCDHTS